jgi:hypothetical protein
VPPLRNVRHERFCVALSEGRSIAESYQLAGFKKNRGNSSRLNSNESIRVRVAELQAQTAADSKVTVESICKELDLACQIAREKGQAAAVVSAAGLRAKIAGLLVEKVEVGKPGDFENCEGFADIADKMIDDLIERFCPVDEQDRQGLIDLIERQADEIHGYLKAIKARPITAERVDARDLTTPWQDLQPRSAIARLTRSNGSRA